MGRERECDELFVVRVRARERERRVRLDAIGESESVICNVTGAMARTISNNHFRVVEWNIEHEFGALWKPECAESPALRPYKSIARARSKIDETVEAKEEGQVTKDWASTGGTMIEVVMRTELFAPHDELFGEQMRVDLVVKSVSGT
ncbi:hypothetical protein Mp_1g05770 [Marchantia polymorpha subsp. ruderalis]|uniref:Uncharacterized protein n=2 Tax=Marchantia polymorpha TaxID=3197 RepID=A0AAF6ALX5_MARPO|nr:hypothetical protein MARPO_0005s0030 [Marchantia polymorpha]BBM97445.1 hypothetical protein Mp_1g05770 [Marchantia polymorpha subsp. ruderalis]|eukprot:PTQ48358.1 hypothetical protein MARPO_0005s0030 [Marchantia polymorpha]